MALKDVAIWVVAYDIRSPRRLRKVHKYLSQEAVHVQYSVFLAQGTLQQIGVLRAALSDLIDPREDDVRIYRVPESPLIHTLGAQGLPEGVLMLSAASGQGSVPLTAKSAGSGVASGADAQEVTSADSTSASGCIGGVSGIGPSGTALRAQGD